jgi:hypothetical protein
MSPERLPRTPYRSSEGDPHGIWRVEHTQRSSLVGTDGRAPSLTRYLVVLRETHDTAAIRTTPPTNTQTAHRRPDGDTLPILPVPGQDPSLVGTVRLVALPSIYDQQGVSIPITPMNHDLLSSAQAIACIHQWVIVLPIDPQEREEYPSPARNVRMATALRRPSPQQIREAPIPPQSILRCDGERSNIAHETRPSHTTRRRGKEGWDNPRYHDPIQAPHYETCRSDDPACSRCSPR